MTCHVPYIIYNLIHHTVVSIVIQVYRNLEKKDEMAVKTKVPIVVNNCGPATKPRNLIGRTMCISTIISRTSRIAVAANINDSLKALGAFSLLECMYKILFSISSMVLAFVSI